MSGSYFIGGQNDINGVTISGVPSVGQVIEATSSTTATWQSPGSTITLGGDVTGPANANIVGRLNGGSSGLFALAITDFIAMGGVTVAAAGLVRLPNNAGTIISQRNAGNTGDLPLFATADTNGNFNIGSINSTVAGISTIYAPNTFQIRGTSVIAGQPFMEIASGTYFLFQSASGGALGTGGGFRFTNNASVDYALTISTIYNGATGIGFGESVTSATISQATSLNTSCAQMLIQAQSSAIAASGGGNLILASGVGTGLDGYISLEVGQTQVAQFQLSSTDFIKMGGSVPSLTGALRLSNAPGTIIAQRNSGNTADLVVVSSDTSGNSVFGAGAAASSSLNPTSATVFINCAGSGSGVMTLNSAAGTFNNTNGMQFSDSNGTVAIGFVPAHAGNAYIAFGPTLTSANIAHTTKPSTGATAGVNMIISAQPGQQQSSTNANNNGGNLVLSSGVAGTGGSGAVGLAGALQLQCGGVNVASYTANVVTGLAHSAGATAIVTVPQTTSGSSVQYEVQVICRATTAFTSGSIGDTFATTQFFSVRNVGGTLTAVSSVTTATSTQSDTSVAGNSLTMTLAGTNVTFNITPPVVAAGIETVTMSVNAITG